MPRPNLSADQYARLLEAVQRAAAAKEPPPAPDQGSAAPLHGSGWWSLPHSVPKTEKSGSQLLGQYNTTTLLLGNDNKTAGMHLAGTGDTFRSGKD